MRNVLITCLLFLFCVSTRGFASVIFYTDQGAFQTAVNAAGYSSVMLNFNAVPTLAYPAGLPLGGVLFTDAAPGVVSVSTAGPPGFGPSVSGNLLTGITELDITLPPGIKAAGGTIDSSLVWFTGASATAILTLPTGDTASVALTQSQPFPFLGFISNSPVNSMAYTTPAFVELQNFVYAPGLVIGPTALAPEPSTDAEVIAGLMLVALAALRRRS
jgi:hypothetical protein